MSSNRSYFHYRHELLRVGYQVNSFGSCFVEFVSSFKEVMHQLDDAVDVCKSGY